MGRRNLVEQNEAQDRGTAIALSAALSESDAFRQALLNLHVLFSGAQLLLLDGAFISFNVRQAKVGKLDT